MNSGEKKKKVLLRTIGPPTVPPNWFWVSLGLVVPGEKAFLASRFSLRRNSHSAPWKSLVPDLVAMIIWIGWRPFSGAEAACFDPEFGDCVDVRDRDAALVHAGIGIQTVDLELRVFHRDTYALHLVAKLKSGHPDENACPGPG